MNVTEATVQLKKNALIYAILNHLLERVTATKTFIFLKYKLTNIVAFRDSASKGAARVEGPINNFLR